MPEPIRLALINDHPLVVEGLRAMLRPYPELDVVELNTLVEVRGQVDVALVDTYAQAQQLPDTIRQRLAEETISRVALYTWQMGESLVSDALQAGACGVLSKTLTGEQLVADLQRLARDEQVVDHGTGEQEEPDPELVPGRPAPGRDWPGRSEGLSVREGEMISLICQGLSNEQIAERLYLSLNSVKSYIRAAYQKTGVSSRSQAVIWGIEHGMRPVPRRTEV